MAKTSQFDGQAAKLFSALEHCPPAKLEANFLKLQGAIGSRSSTKRMIERQHGKSAKHIGRRLAEAKLI